MTARFPSQLPLIGAPIVDPQSGEASDEFRRFLTMLHLRTGGPQGSNAQDNATTAASALQSATSAAATASDANTTAANAQSAAAAASALAQQAMQQAGLATVQASLALQQAENLADVPSKSTARSNLHLSVRPITITFTSLTAGNTLGVPIVESLTFPSHFAGTSVYWATAATADAVFTVSYKRGSITTYLGQITVINGGSGVLLGSCASTSLVAGDALVITAPNPADTTLANCAFTFPLTIG